MTFGPALALMHATGSPTYGPIPFQQYLLEHQLPIRKTAPSISVDTFSGLASDLRDAGVMVFRLGGGVTTAFGLAAHAGSWDDYFLNDAAIFAEGEPELFIPSGAARDLFAFHLLPALTESSFVNLALASGVLGAALDLDDPLRPIIPATGQSRFTFDFRPHASYDAVWTHQAGQVEIDAIFVARRGGRETLFVVEAKAGRFDTLAKHKLVYPMLALRGHIPSYFEVVPVYLRATRQDGRVEFRVCECKVNPVEPVSLSSLHPARPPRHFAVEI